MHTSVKGIGEQKINYNMVKDFSISIYIYIYAWMLLYVLFTQKKYICVLNSFLTVIGKKIHCQTVQTLMRCHRMWHLIRVCTVCYDIKITIERNVIKKNWLSLKVCNRWFQLYCKSLSDKKGLSDMWSYVMHFCIIIPPANFVCGGYSVFTFAVRPCVRPSVRNALFP